MDRQFYDEYARIQDEHWWFAGRRKIIGSVLQSSLPDRPERRILDIGCGTGTNLAELNRFGSVEGVDSEPAAVEQCRRDGWNVTEVGDGALPFADGSFDVVTLLDVIEHVDDDRALLAEARRLLAHGGTVLVAVPAYTWMWGAQDVISHHRRRYTASRLRAALVDAGLVPRRTTYFNTLLFPPIALVRILRRLRGSEDGGEVVSDFEMNRPGRMNAILARIFGLEARMLRSLGFPFGVSVLAVARRSGD